MIKYCSFIEADFTCRNAANDTAAIAAYEA